MEEGKKRKKRGPISKEARQRKRERKRAAIGETIDVLRTRKKEPKVVEASPDNNFGYSPEPVVFYKRDYASKTGKKRIKLAWNHKQIEREKRRNEKALKKATAKRERDLAMDLKRLQAAKESRERRGSHSWYHPRKRYISPENFVDAHGVSHADSVSYKDIDDALMNSGFRLYEIAFCQKDWSCLFEKEYFFKKGNKFAAGRENVYVGIAHKYVKALKYRDKEGNDD